MNRPADFPVFCLNLARRPGFTMSRHWAEKLDVKVAWLGVRPMRNKWASCSSAGHLNFNDDLLQLDGELWDYVIVHELLRFFVPNHGKLCGTSGRSKCPITTSECRSDLTLEFALPTHSHVIGKQK